MTTMLSLILAFMLSIGGSPAASVNPAGCPENTGIQVPVDNNSNINGFFEDYNQKTASRPISKKIIEIPLINQPKTQIRIRFSLFLKDKLRLVGYMDSMNLYQAFGMNPVNFNDPMGTEISAESIKYWGSYGKALKYIKYVYGLYLEGGDSAGTAYNKLVSNGLVTDIGSPEDINFSVKLAISPSLDVFDVTPAQFGKDLLGGVINAVTSMVSMAAKGLPGGCNPYLWAQIDKTKNWAQSKINKAIGANEGSIGYWMGETYAPAIAGGWLSAELELANATAQTQKILPFKTIPKLRQQYIDEVLALKGKIPTLEKAGMTQEEIARTLYSERNALKIKYRELTPKNRLIEIENRCVNKYGNKLGPTIEQLRAKGKTWEQIIESATISGGQDLGF
jgi:hypothetical protein